jgi:hypothetical protein
MSVILRSEGAEAIGVLSTAFSNPSPKLGMDEAANALVMAALVKKERRLKVVISKMSGTRIYRIIRFTGF